MMMVRLIDAAATVDDDDDDDEDDDDDDDDDDLDIFFDDWDPPSWSFGSKAPAPPGWKFTPEFPAPYFAEKIPVPQGPQIDVKLNEAGKVLRA